MKHALRIITLLGCWAVHLYSYTPAFFVTYTDEYEAPIQQESIEEPTPSPFVIYFDPLAVGNSPRIEVEVVSSPVVDSSPTKIETIPESIQEACTPLAIAVAQEVNLGIGEGRTHVAASRVMERAYSTRISSYFPSQQVNRQQSFPYTVVRPREVRRAFDRYVNHHDYLKEWPNQAKHLQRMSQRCQALIQVAKDGKVCEQSINLDQKSSDLLRDCDIDATQFNRAGGNAAQIALHAEYVCILDDVANLIYGEQPIHGSWISECHNVVKVASIGVQAHQEGELFLSYKIADWCYAALELLEMAENQKCEAVKIRNPQNPNDALAFIYSPKVVLHYQLLPWSWEIIKEVEPSSSLSLKSGDGNYKDIAEETRVFIEGMKCVEKAARAYYDERFFLNKVWRVITWTSPDASRKMCSFLRNNYRSIRKEFFEPAQHFIPALERVPGSQVNIPTKPDVYLAEEKRQLVFKSKKGTSWATTQSVIPQNHSQRNSSPKIMDSTAIKKVFQEYSNEMNNVVQYEQYDDAQKEITAKRLSALQRSGNAQIITRQLEVSQHGQTVLRECKIEINRFAQITGNEAQIELHQEFIDIVHNVGEFCFGEGHVNPEWQPSCYQIAKIADIGVEANKEGELLTGYRIADWCRVACDVVEAITDGIIEGVSVVVQDAIDHPIQAIGTVVAPELVFAYHMIPMSWELLKNAAHVSSIGLECVRGNTAPAQEEFDEWVDWISRTKNYAYKLYNETSLTDKVKGVAGIATQLIVQHKMYSSLGDVYKNAEDCVVAAVKNKISLPQLQAATIPGGPSVKLAEEKGSVFFCAKNRGGDKIGGRGTANAAHLKSNGNTVRSSGRVCPKVTTPEATKIAKALGFEKTNFYTSCKQAIYKKGKYYISIDVDAHSGGFWKMAKSIKDLEHIERRLGTYDINLNRIGD